MENRNRLRKELGVFSGISLVAGLTVGSGVYYVGSYVLERVNMSMGMALLCWIISGVVSILGGLCFAELGAEMPVTGGMTTYFAKAYHPMMAFINGFSSWLLTASGTIASLAMAAVTPFADEFTLPDPVVKTIAVALIVIFSAINLRGIRTAAKIQNASMIIRLIPLALVIIVGIFFGSEKVDLRLSNAFEDGVNPGPVGCIKMIGFAVFASLWAFDGWVDLNTVAGEMKNPRRNLPIAIIVSLLGITVIYTLFQFSIYRVIPQAEVSSMIADGKVYLGQETAFRIMGGFGKWSVMIGMTIGIVGTVNGDCIIFPRTYYSMARGGYFFKSAGEVNRHGVPGKAILFSSALSIILVVFNSLQQLTDWLITVTTLLNMLAIVAVLVFRKKYPDMERPYKVWGGVPVIILTIIFFAVLLINQFISDPVTSLKGLIIVAICIPFYFIFRKMNGGKDYDTDAIDN